MMFKKWHSGSCRWKLAIQNAKTQSVKLGMFGRSELLKLQSRRKRDGLPFRSRITVQQRNQQRKSLQNIVINGDFNAQMQRCKRNGRNTEEEHLSKSLYTKRPHRLPSLEHASESTWIRTCNINALFQLIYVPSGAALTWMKAIPSQAAASAPHLFSTNPWVLRHKLTLRDQFQMQ